MKNSTALEADSKTLSILRMTVCWMVFSVLALFSGIAMVLLLCHFVIVPYMREKDLVTTDCVVDTINFIPEMTNRTCRDTSENMTSQMDTSSCDVMLDEEQSFRNSHSETDHHDPESGQITYCVQVTIVYKGFDGFTHKATLQVQPQEESVLFSEKVCQILQFRFPLKITSYSKSL